jgi:hypothetical protein
MAPAACLGETTACPHAGAMDIMTDMQHDVGTVPTRSGYLDQRRRQIRERGRLQIGRQPLLLGEPPVLAGVKYLLTFRPFSALPENIRQAYLQGQLHLLPSPASLVFWGSPPYLQLHRELPLGLQVPLLYTVARHQAPQGLRVPQAGILFVPNSHGQQPHVHHELVRNTYRRTHRWDKILRDQDELELLGREHPLLHVLFSSIPDDLALYDKPLARNARCPLKIKK